MANAGEGLHKPALIVELMADRAEMAENAVDREGLHQPALVVELMADGAEMAENAVEGLHEDLPQPPVAPVAELMAGEGAISGEILSKEEVPIAPIIEPAGERGGSREIVSEEEEVLHRDFAAPGVIADGRQLTDVESGVVLRRSTNVQNVTSDSSWVRVVCALPHPNCAKWVYAAIFLGGMILAMESRDTEVSAFSATERAHGCEHDRYCLIAESALRVSLAFFIFFMFMFITTVWTKKVQDWRNYWNSNLVLPLKIAMLVACLFAVQFTPSPSIQLYGSASRFGAWFFLVIQLISVTRFIMFWNIKLQSITNRWRWLVQVASILSNFGSFGVILWIMREHTSNIVDLAIVSVTLILMVLMISSYMKSEVPTSWIAPGMILVYTVFMCWTAITSEPHRDLTEEKHPKGADWLTITSFIVAVIVMAYSTLGAGEDTEWLQFNEKVPSADDIPYAFGYFHLVFALGSMYFGMILVGWNAHQTRQRWTMDFGWWSAVVRAVNGLLAAALYIWMLRTPFIWDKKKVVLSWSRASSTVPTVTFL